ncbi:hypothetical protein Lalb_Chr23g0268611 [Lupinus albus]|uniref:Uncharacterized protein n=1 Tax=Lupinus albus TaxID=3870 RepID=A0A6A4N6T2_LUPAL|nr:hypothetical protein Lalb_Chr23g0268611 [Lupinus albus]
MDIIIFTSIMINGFSSRAKNFSFYWLDIGEGRELNLEKCPPTKLYTQCIKYLGPVAL